MAPYRQIGKANPHTVGYYTLHTVHTLRKYPQLISLVVMWLPGTLLSERSGLFRNAFHPRGREVGWGWGAVGGVGPGSPGEYIKLVSRSSTHRPARPVSERPTLPLPLHDHEFAMYPTAAYRPSPRPARRASPTRLRGGHPQTRTLRAVKCYLAGCFTFTGIKVKWILSSVVRTYSKVGRGERPVKC